MASGEGVWLQARGVALGESASLLGGAWLQVSA